MDLFKDLAIPRAAHCNLYFYKKKPQSIGNKVKFNKNFKLKNKKLYVREKRQYQVSLLSHTQRPCLTFHCVEAGLENKLILKHI